MRPRRTLFVSGSDARGGEIFKFTWDGGQSIFASGLYKPWDMAFDSAGNLFFVDCEILDDGGGGLRGDAAIYKMTPNKTLTIFASRLSYPSYLAVDRTGNVFVADYDNGIIYKYKPTGSRAIFALGLHHPVGMAFDSSGICLWPITTLATSIKAASTNTNLMGRGRPLPC